jgi:long-chain fatty acid transport protein
MKKILGSVTIAAALVATPAYATNGMRLTGFGPVQQSMGGASVAAPLDSATAATNPAGLSLLAPRLDIAGAAFSPTVKYDIGGQGDTSSRPTDFLPTVGAIFRVQDQLTLGVAVLGTSGMGVKYDNFGGPGAAMMSSYSNARVAPAVAYKINDQFSVGLALNLMYAQMKFSEPTAGGELSIPTAGSFGYGATIGATYKASDMVTIGAAFETESYFQDFSLEVPAAFGGTTKLKLDQPMVATLGVGVTPVQGLLLALDGEWINWSAVLGKNKPTTTPDMGFNLNWKDQFVVKLGAQYQLPSMKELSLRAGFNYGKAPIDTASAGETLLFPAIAEMHVMLGAGYDFGKWGVNASFMYSPEASASGTMPPSFGGAPYTTKMSQTEFGLGVAYRM